MSVNINGSTGVSLVQDGVIVTADMASSVPLGAKNKIINGNLGINQRAVTGSVVLGAGIYGHDRWKAGASGCSYTFATTANVTTITISAGSLLQVIEGLNLQSGTHTLSWTGTATAKIGGGSYSASGVTGTVTGGTNMTIDFSTGTLSLVQLEEGSTATPFEHRMYGQELSLCQRYFQMLGGDTTFSASHAWATGAVFNTTDCWMSYQLPTTMRASPTITNDISSGVVQMISDGTKTVSALNSFSFNAKGGRFKAVITGGVSGYSGVLQAVDSDGNYIKFAAEL